LEPHPGALRSWGDSKQKPRLLIYQPTTARQCSSTSRAVLGLSGISRSFAAHTSTGSCRCTYFKAVEVAFNNEVVRWTSSE